MTSNLLNICVKCKRIFTKTGRFYRKINRYSSAPAAQDVVDGKIRTLGILAHIDAGKTTTTERMLFLSGLIDHMGEVHRGNTVTDYMQQERERGITITSAAVTFYWRKNQFNLIDTPGHIDFTMEVEQSLNVLDGAVVVLDGSAGVEAQTITVWRQADKNKLPRIIFVNKMDKYNADLEHSCRMIEKKLEIPYLLLQLPVKKNDKFVGIIDILSMELLTYGTNSDKTVNKERLTHEKHKETFENTKIARTQLIDKLSNYDDSLANKIISLGSLETIPTDDIVKALKRATVNQKAVPVLIGSAYKNFGVQNLMDAIVLYLPSTNETNSIYKAFESNLCARAFKVVHDKHRGPLVFLRIYNGQLKKGQKIYSIKQKCSEQVGRLYLAYADDFKEVDSISSGNIAVVAGLKNVMSGDLVTNSNSVSQKAKTNILKTIKDEKDIDRILGIDVSVPEPVFFRSIEPPSSRSQGALDQALVELQREDPSLRVTHNSETGQTVLGGMGELHLEIIKDRILREYKIDADLGPLQIAYRELPNRKATDTVTLETKIASSNQSVTCKLTVEPIDPSIPIKDTLKLDKSPEYASNIATIFPKHLVAVKQGIEFGLSHGPKVNCPIVHTQVILHLLHVGKGTSDTFISATVTQLVQRILRDVGTTILEPIMSLEIVTPEEHLSGLLADLTRRRAVINNVGVRGNSKLVLSKAPLSELKGYSTILRTLSSGTATFTMVLDEYEKMSPSMEELAIRDVRGF